VGVCEFWTKQKKDMDGRTRLVSSWPLTGEHKEAIFVVLDDDDDVIVRERLSMDGILFFTSVVMIRELVRKR